MFSTKQFPPWRLANPCCEFFQQLWLGERRQSLTLDMWCLLNKVLKGVMIVFTPRDPPSSNPVTRDGLHLPHECSRLCTKKLIFPNIIHYRSSGEASCSFITRRELVTTYAHSLGTANSQLISFYRIIFNVSANCHHKDEILLMAICRNVENDSVE